MTALTKLKGVGPRTADRLGRLHINSIEDLIFHLPFRYQDRTRVKAIANLRLGDHAVIEVTIIKKTLYSQGKRRYLQCQVKDHSGTMQLTWFNFHGNMQQQLAEGVTLRCFAEVRPGRPGLAMVHPEYQVIIPGEEVAVAETLTPIYHSTNGLSQNILRQLIIQALEYSAQNTIIEDYLQQVLDNDTTEIWQHLKYLHNPPPDADTEKLTNGSDFRIKRLALERISGAAVGDFKFTPANNQAGGAKFNSY